MLLAIERVVPARLAMLAGAFVPEAQDAQEGRQEVRSAAAEKSPLAARQVASAQAAGRRRSQSYLNK